MERFNEIVVVLISLLVMMTAVAIALFIKNERLDNENKALNREAEAYRTKLTTMRNEREALLARLIAAETALKIESGIEMDARAQPQKKRMNPQREAQAQKVGTDKPPSPDPASAQEEKDTGAKDETLTIAVDNFSISRDKHSQKLKVGFDIRNTGPPEKPISGKMAVVLRDGNDNPANWLVVQGGKLINGKPQPRGSKRFRIAYYKDIVFKSAYSGDPGRFQSATVYIFSETNRLLEEREFAVKLK